MPPMSPTVALCCLQMHDLCRVHQAKQLLILSMSPRASGTVKDDQRQWLHAFWPASPQLHRLACTWASSPHRLRCTWACSPTPSALHPGRLTHRLACTGQVHPSRLPCNWARSPIQRLPCTGQAQPTSVCTHLPMFSAQKILLRILLKCISHLH